MRNNRPGERAQAASSNDDGGAVLSEDSINKLARRIYETLRENGCIIGNACVPIIEREIEDFCEEGLLIFRGATQQK